MEEKINILLVEDNPGDAKIPMGLILSYTPGQTPLDEDEKAGILLPHISTIGELNEFEQLNIQEAFEWLMKQRTISTKLILTEKFIKDIHRRMFGSVWKWAGAFRKTNKNIGVDWFHIAESVRILIDDCRFWIEKNVYCKDEIAIRFKHRLVAIHPFPNGNGRHSRLMADILIEYGLNEKPFSWGNNANLVTSSDVRSSYINALKEADSGNYKPLLIFSRS